MFTRIANCHVIIISSDTLTHTHNHYLLGSGGVLAARVPRRGRGSEAALAQPRQRDGRADAAHHDPALALQVEVLSVAHHSVPAQLQGLQADLPPELPGQLEGRRVLLTLTD